MRRLTVLILICFILASCIPFAYAAETVKLPALPELTFEEPYPARFDTHHVVLKIGSDYYAIVFSQFKDIGGINGLGVTYFSEGWRMTFRDYYVRYVETYKLSDLNAWELAYKSNEPSGDTAYQQIWLDSVVPQADWTYGYNYDELVAYSDLTTLRIYTFENASSTAKTYGADYEYSVEFEGGTSDDGSDDSGILSGVVDALKDLGEWIITSVSNIIDGLLSGINALITWLYDGITAIGQFLLDGISALFQPIIDYFKDLTETTTSVLEKLLNLITNLFENFSNYTLDPVNNFINGIDVVSINLWMSFFDFPILSDFMMISVIVGLFTALIVFLKSR